VYEALVDALAHARDAASPADDLARALIDEHLARRDHWRRPGSGVGFIERAGHTILLSLVPATWRSAKQAALGVPILVGVLILGGWLGLGAMLIALVSILVVLVALEIQREGRSAALARRLEQRCPTCGYDLGGVPRPIDAALLDGIDVGPRVCPECGLAWPWAQPPVP